MKPQQVKQFINELKSKGWIEHNNVFYPPEQIEALNLKPVVKKRTKTIKTGWIDDTRNLKNRNSIDTFTMLLSQQLNLDAWPEFYFSTERLYRLDYAIPFAEDGTELKLGIEVNGGIWSKGNSGHSSGTGIQRDIDKSALAASLGWTVISRTPQQLLTNETLELIKKIIKNK